MAEIREKSGAIPQVLKECIARKGAAIKNGKLQSLSIKSSVSDLATIILLLQVLQ